MSLMLPIVPEFAANIELIIYNSNYTGNFFVAVHSYSLLCVEMLRRFSSTKNRTQAAICRFRSLVTLSPKVYGLSCSTKLLESLAGYALLIFVGVFKLLGCERFLIHLTPEVGNVRNYKWYDERHNSHGS